MKIFIRKFLFSTILAALIDGQSFAQSDPPTVRTVYINQLYETNDVSLLIQAQSIAFFSGNIGAATNVINTSTNIVRPNDGTNGIYLLASAIGQPVGMFTVPFELLVQGRGTIAALPDMYAGTNWYQLGQIVSLAATPGRYYGFSNWLDGVSFNPRSVVAGVANSFTAVFTNGPALETNVLGSFSRVAPVGTPVVLINGQYYPDDIVVTNAGALVQVTLQTSFAGGTIFYTTDGVTPAVNGAAYTGAFTLAAPFSIRAVAFSAGFLDSAEADPVSTVVATTPGAGTVTVATSKSFYTGESFAAVTGSPNAGWTFLGWTNDASGANPAVILPVASAKTVKGIFGTAFNYATNGGGSIIRNPGQSQYPFGSVVQFSAVPAAGSNFVTWGGALTGVATNPATLVVSSPTQTVAAVFAQLPPGNHALSVLVSGNGSVSRSTNANFYTNGTVVTLTANPGEGQSFINWSGDAAGTVNPLPVTMNASKIITANFAPTAPVFLLGAATYEVNENAAAVSLVVSNLGTLGGSVNFATTNLTAVGGADYVSTNGTLAFTNGEPAKTISVGIVDRFLVAGDKTFKVFLSNQSTGSIASPAEAVVTIHYNDIGATNGSFLVQQFPAAVPNRSASLRVTIASPVPAASGGFWRFPWELGWRASGTLVSNLIQAEYDVEFRDLAGYFIPQVPAQLVLSNAPPTELTNSYTQTAPPGAGRLTVNIGPNNLALITNAGWRLLGETNWLSPGQTLSNQAAAANYLIEFKPVSGFATPGIREVALYANQHSIISTYYGQPMSLPPNIALPTPLPGIDYINASLTNHPRLPYAFNGQLKTSAGYGSGFAARPHSVLTAAHLVFDDVTLSYASQVYWFFQKHTPDLEPKPSLARGYYLLAGYAAARTNDLIVLTNYAPGVSSPESRNADVAVTYFLDPGATRGGYGGYLASESATNEWLTGSQPKLLVGYPLDGTPFGYTNVVAGKMHATTISNFVFTLQTNQVYTSGGFQSFPGNSGGPVYVLGNNGIFYPAAIYLGTSANGSASVVRAIDTNVVNLLNLAESSATFGDSGTNFNGGGVIRIVSSVGGSGVAYFDVKVGPLAALQAGGGWRFRTLGDTNQYSHLPITPLVFTKAVTNVIEFANAPGWDAPPPRTVTISIGQTTEVEAGYVAMPPSMAFTPAGFGIIGATNTSYRIEYTTNLVTGAWLPLQTNLITSGGFNLLLSWPPTNNLPAAFYRAMWIPE